MTTSRDALFGGRVALLQPARGDGYRMNIDALLLAAFAADGRRARRAFDLGAGAGGIALALLHWDAAERVVLVEVDEVASAAARANLDANGWAARGEVLACSVTDLSARAGEADLVVSNPPFVRPGRGRLPARPARARARSGDLALFTRAARAVLGRRGRACFVYPAHDLAALLVALAGAGLVAKRLRAVHARKTAPARVVMVEARPGKPGGLVVAPPLVERGDDGYGAELRALLAGALSAPRRRADRG